MNGFIRRVCRGCVVNPPACFIFDLVLRQNTLTMNLHDYFYCFLISLKIGNYRVFLYPSPLIIDSILPTHICVIPL
jgi:hypothetical protein